MRICTPNANQHTMLHDTIMVQEFGFLSHAQNIQYAMPFGISKNIIKSFENQENLPIGIRTLVWKVWRDV